MKLKLTILSIFTFVLGSYAQESNTIKKWSLQECVDYALEHNITIKQSENDIELAEIGKKDALGNFLPTLNINGSQAWNSGLTTDVTTGVLRNQTTANTSAGLSSGIMIYGGRQNVNQMRKAELSILANRYQMDKIKDDITLNVINAYLKVLFDMEAINVAKPQLEISQEQLSRSEKLVEAGTIPKGDLYEIQATVANDEQNLIVTENNKKLSLLSLAQLLQLENADNFDISDTEIASLPLVNLANYSVQDIYAKALENRNEIRVAKANIELAEKDIALAKGALQPQLTGFFNWNSRYSDINGFQSYIDPNDPTQVIGIVEGTNQNVLGPKTSVRTVGADSFFDQFGDNKGYSYGLSLNIPVFNGFKASNNVKKAKIFKEQQEYQLDKEELDLERIINTVYLDARGALKVYDAAKKSVAAQEESFRYAQEKFNVGVMNSFEFSQIKNNVVKAQSDFLRAKYDFIFKVKLLEFYYGIPVEVN